MGKDGIWDGRPASPGEGGHAGSAMSGIRRLRSFLSLPLGPAPPRGDGAAWLALAFACGAILRLNVPMPPSAPAMTVALPAALLLTVIALRGGHATAALGASLLAGLFWMDQDLADDARPRPLPANVGRVELEGRVVRIWRSAPRRIRLIVQVENMSRIRPEHAPRTVRLTMMESRRDRSRKLPLPGDVITATVRLTRLPGPVEPGGHDPAQHLWFEGIAATGFLFARDMKVRDDTACAECGPRLRTARELEKLRRAIDARIFSVMGREDGRAPALATALLTGSRGHLPQQTREDLRRAGLAHILAISGLHLSLVAGLVFWLVRAGFALSTHAALHWPIRRIAAAAALIAALAYLLISGNSVATRRAFIMLSVVTLAVMLDRPAITMRSLAVAAWLILLLQPHMAVRAGFQMSFLAVAGLVAVYEMARWYRDRRESTHVTDGMRSRSWRILRKGIVFLGGILVSTMTAGLMTMLPVAWHFHRLAAFSIAGNLVALPVLTLMVMPAGILALILMPFGLDGPFFHIMRQGLEIILDWSAVISVLPDSVIHVPVMSPVAAGLILAGLAVLVLRRDAWRMTGLLPVLVGLLLPPAQRPDIFINLQGRVAAFRNAEGNLVPGPGRAGRFALSRWLLGDGDGTPPREARKRPGWNCENRICRARFRPPGAARDLHIVYARERPRRQRRNGTPPDGAWLTALERACEDADVVIADFPLRRLCRHVPVRIDRFDLWAHGAHALHARRDGTLRIWTAADFRRHFPWGRKPLPRREVLMETRLKGTPKKERLGGRTSAPALP